MYAGWSEFFNTQDSPECTGNLTDTDCLGNQTVMVTLTAEDVTAGEFEATIRYHSVVLVNMRVPTQRLQGQCTIWCCMLRETTPQPFGGARPAT